jgi:hypothetical protein
MRLGLIRSQDLITRRLKVVAATVRTAIEVRKGLWTAQPVLYSNAHDLSTIEADARLDFDPLKA